MIKLVNSDTLLKAEHRGAVATRLRSTAGAYGNDSRIMLCWLQYSGDGAVTASLGCLDGDMTVCCCDGADRDEIGQFVSVIHPRSVTSNEPIISGQCGFDVYGRDVCGGNAAGDFPDFRRCYDIFTERFDMPPFDEWYVDMSHRTRHGYSVCIANGDGAVCAHHDGSAALICGIASSVGGEGCGRRLLNAVIGRLPHGVGRISAVISDDGPRGFYEKCGFLPDGKVFIANF